MRLTGNRVKASVITRPELETNPDVKDAFGWKRYELPKNLDKIRLLPQFKNGANVSLYKNGRQYSDKVLQQAIVMNRFEIAPDEKVKCYHPTNARDIFDKKVKFEKTDDSDKLYQHQI